MRKRLVIGAAVLSILGPGIGSFSGDGPRSGASGRVAIWATGEGIRRAPNAPVERRLLRGPLDGDEIDRFVARTLRADLPSEQNRELGSEPPGAGPASITVAGDISFALVVLAVDAEDVRRYVPEEFQAFGTGGKAIVLVGAGFFEGISIDGRPVPDFQWSELFVLPAGDPGTAVPAPWGYYVWRLSNRAEPLAGLALVGLTCGRESTFICHVPQLTVERTETGSMTRVEAEVPWNFSPYSLSATFGTDDVAPIGYPDNHVWLRGVRGLVREDFMGSDQFSTFGVGSVRPRPGTPLFRILGERSEATGPAQSWRFHFESPFTLVE